MVYHLILMIINRVWIIKKSINLDDLHVTILATGNILIQLFSLFAPIEKNVFKIINGYEFNFKHWAIILELSNGTYVNIQFGKEGFSLKEFNKTNVEGEAVLNSIISTWGEDGHPFSFCYLGYANYEYERLKRILKEIKNTEKKCFEKEGSVYYNILFYNCQHFACDIEKILFGYIMFWHSFDYYLNQFYEYFFRYIDINILELEYENKLNQINKKIFESNVKNSNNLRVECNEGNKKLLEWIDVILFSREIVNQNNKFLSKILLTI